MDAHLRRTLERSCTARLGSNYPRSRCKRIYIYLVRCIKIGHGPLGGEELSPTKIHASRLIRGILTSNIEPSPILLSTKTSPPCACTIHCTIDRPRPVPPSFSLAGVLCNNSCLLSERALSTL